MPVLPGSRWLEHLARSKHTIPLAGQLRGGRVLWSPGDREELHFRGAQRHPRRGPRSYSIRWWHHRTPASAISTTRQHMRRRRQLAQTTCIGAIFAGQWQHQRGQGWHHTSGSQRCALKPRSGAKEPLHAHGDLLWWAPTGLNTGWLFSESVSTMRTMHAAPLGRCSLIQCPIQLRS